MDIGTLIAGSIAAIAAIVGIVAGIVQVAEYLQKRREKRTQAAEAKPPIALDASAHDDHSLHAQAEGDVAAGGGTIEKQYGGAHVERAERVIIVQEPPALPEPPPLLVPPVLSNLPSRSEFIGREKEMARVHEALASRAFLVCIDGIGGIGKTALALEVAHACLNEKAFEGVIWTTAKDRELTLSDVLDAVARTLDYPGVAQQPLAEKRESVRRLLQARPYLLAVDNFETITDDAVRDFLLELPEPSKALVTSREQKLRQAAAVSLRGLEPGEALQLIRSEGRKLGLAAVEQAEDRVLLRLYQATGGAPLALKWAVGQIKQRGQSLDTVLTALHEAKAEDVFEAMFARSWSLLTEEARRVLLVMPIFASSASRAAIEAASDVRHYALDEALGQLVQMSLVDASDELDEARRRYSVHPLTRAFALARLRENAAFEQEARERAARYFIQFAQANKVTQDQREGAVSLQTELSNLLAVAEWCCQRSLLVEFIELVETIGLFLGMYGYYDDWIRLGVMLVPAAERVDRSRLAAEWAVWVLGWTYYQQDALDDAEWWYRKGLETFEQLEDQWWIATTERHLALVLRERGDYDEAERLMKRALAAYENMAASPADGFVTFESPTWWRTHYGPVDIADTLRSLGGIAYRKGDYGVARDYYEKSLEIHKAVGDKEGLSHSSYHLGMVALKTGQLGEAQMLFQASLVGAKEFTWMDLKANTQRGLAYLMEIRSEHESALVLARETLAAYERMGKRRDIRETRALIERLEGKLSTDASRESEL